MLLIRLTGDQVAANWDVIRFGIENSLPPVAEGGDTRMNSILEEILLGGVQCWATTDNPEVTNIRVLALTYIMTDPLSKMKTIIGYCMYGFVRMTPEDAKLIFEGTKLYGISKDCTKMATYTQSDNVKSIGAKLGVHEEWSYLTVEL